MKINNPTMGGKNDTKDLFYTIFHDCNIATGSLQDNAQIVEFTC